MGRKYEKKVAPFQVIIRMPYEAVARCWQNDLCADNITLLKPGEAKRPSTLWLRPSYDGRSVMWYWIEDIGNGMKPLATGCVEEDRDGAIAWVLTYLSRKVEQAQARLGPEEMRVIDILDKYRRMVERQFTMKQICKRTRTSYRGGVARLAKCFRKATLWDIVEGGRDRYYDWGAQNGVDANSCLEDVNTLKRAINWVMEAEGSAFRVAFWVGMRAPAQRMALDPDQYLRILDVLKNNVRYDADLKIVMVRDKVTGEMRPKTAGRQSWKARVPLLRAFVSMIDTGGRPNVLVRSTWTGANKTPHLDPDSGIWIRNPLLEPEVKEKKKGMCVVSPEFQSEAGSWMEEDLDAGIEHVVHDWEGNPVETLSSTGWKTVLEHARVPHRKLYSAKHTAITIGFTEGVSLQQMSQRFSVTPEVLTGTYALQDNPGNQIDAAIAQGKKAKWFANHEIVKQRQARAEAAREARAERHAVNPPPALKPLGPPPPLGKLAPRASRAALARTPQERGRALASSTLRTRGAVNPARAGMSRTKQPTEN